MLCVCDSPGVWLLAVHLCVYIHTEMGCAWCVGVGIGGVFGATTEGYEIALQYMMCVVCEVCGTVLCDLCR